MTQLATLNQFESFEVLDIYSETGTREKSSRPDALATISAGFKNDKGIPTVSRDGTIHVHDPEGRAKGLVDILKRNGGKRLTITPAFDDPKAFIQTRFARYSASRLECYGDQFGITEIYDTGKKKVVAGKQEAVYDRRVFGAGTTEYKDLKATCKVSCSLYFYLAAWNEDGTPKILFPDGFGMYRLRFTSRNSLDNLLDNLKTVAYYNGGHVAGVPFELQIVAREIADATGSRRKVPVWTMTMKHPTIKELDSRAVRQMLTAGIQEAQQLSLPAPRAETIDMATGEIIDVDLDQTELDSDDLRQLSDGQSPRFRIKQWHATVRNTVLEDAKSKDNFLTLETEYEHISDAAKYLTQPEWDDLIATACKWISEAATAQTQVATEQKINAQPAAEGVTEDMVEHLREICKASKLPPTSWLEFLAFVAGQKQAYGKLSDVDLSDVETILKRCGDDDPSGGWLIDDEMALPALVTDYNAWLESDEHAAQVLG